MAKLNQRKDSSPEMKLVYRFIHFIISLPVSYVKHSWCNCQRLAKHLLKLIQRIVRILQQKDSHVQVCWIFWEIFFFFQIWIMGEECGHCPWCYCFKFLEGIRLHWLFHAGFEDIRFLKWCDVTVQILGFSQY